jgi:hypothetical protein
MADTRTAENIDNLARQILAQGTTSRWTGGLAPETAARYMADDLARSGITDINQLGRSTVTTPGSTISTEAGEEVIPEQTVEQYINKLTGQQVHSGYGERTQGNLWSGSYEGKGNTGFGVQFDAKGNPIFYTQGASSNDLATMLADDPLLAAAAQIAAGYFGGPGGTAALNLAMGKDPKDIAKSVALSYLGNEAFKGLSDVNVDTNAFGKAGADFATDLKDIFGKTGSELVGKTAGQYVASGGKADIGTLLLTQGAGVATNAVLGEIPGFNDLKPNEKSFVTKLVTSTLNDGKLSTSEAINAALSAGKQAVNSANKSNDLRSSLTGFDTNSEDLIQGYFQPGGQGYIDPTTGEMTVQQEPENIDAFLRSLSPYAADGGKSVFAQGEDLPEMETVSNRPITSLDSIFGNTNILQDVPDADVPEMVITDDRETPYVPSIRTKDIVSDIPDEITPDQIATLFPNININDILQTRNRGTKFYLIEDSIQFYRMNLFIHFFIKNKFKLPKQKTNSILISCILNERSFSHREWLKKPVEWSKKEAETFF